MKKKLLIFATLLLFVIFVLSGCEFFSAKEGSASVDAYLYYIEENGTALTQVTVSLPDGSKEEKVEYLTNQLLNPPAGKISPICDGAKLNYVKIEDEIATVDFSKEFTDVKNPKYTLSPAAVAKTLCSLNFISGVNILVDGLPALGIDGTPIGIIMKSDVMGDEGSSGATKTTVSLYFGDEMGEGLVLERRNVEIPSSSTVERVIVDEIIKGPVTSGNISVIPAGVKVLSVETKNRVCFVNLSKEFIDRFTGGSSGEVLTVYSIVNSLTELDTVGSVQFLVEGEKKDSLSHMAINEPIARDKSVIIE
ncbi:MAG: GerMN domain-containing protein [Clostridia bacterium]|nr:GerMN domain-containing protein [Clostridia bacterium]